MFKLILIRLEVSYYKLKILLKIEYKLKHTLIINYY